MFLAVVQRGAAPPGSEVLVCIWLLSERPVLWAQSLLSLTEKAKPLRTRLASSISYDFCARLSSVSLKSWKKRGGGGGVCAVITHHVSFQRKVHVQEVAPDDIYTTVFDKLVQVHQHQSADFVPQYLAEYRHVCLHGVSAVCVWCVYLGVCWFEWQSRSHCGFNGTNMYVPSSL